MCSTLQMDSRWTMGQSPLAIPWPPCCTDWITQNCWAHWGGARVVIFCLYRQGSRLEFLIQSCNHTSVRWTELHQRWVFCRRAWWQSDIPRVRAEVWNCRWYLLEQHVHRARVSQSEKCRPSVIDPRLQCTLCDIARQPLLHGSRECDYSVWWESTLNPRDATIRPGTWLDIG